MGKQFTGTGDEAPKYRRPVPGTAVWVEGFSEVGIVENTEFWPATIQVRLRKGSTACRTDIVIPKNFNFQRL